MASVPFLHSSLYPELVILSSKSTPIMYPADMLSSQSLQYWKPVWGALERYWKPMGQSREGAGRMSGTLHLAHSLVFSFVRCDGGVAAMMTDFGNVIRQPFLTRQSRARRSHSASLD